MDARRYCCPGELIGPDESVGTMRDTDAPAGWNWKNGWRAAIWMLLCAELLYVATSRTCESSFDLGILPYYFLLTNLGPAEVLWLLAGGAAFVIAAFPTAVLTSDKNRKIAIAGATCAGLIFQIALPHPYTSQTWPEILQFILAAVAYGVAVGLLLNGSVTVRRYWLPLAIATAFVIGVVEFLVLPYGTPNCFL